ncbi:MAG: response regulator [Anaerolineae bacterium]
MGARILIIDDDRDTALFLKLTLQPYGHEIIQASSLAEGAQAAREEKPDLIILEPAINGGAGFDLCRRLRLLPGERNRPIIMLSSLTRSENVVRGLQAGANAYLTKPVLPEEIIMRVHMLLGYDELPRPKTILVVGAKGGVGATTIAVNLALVLAIEHQKDTVLVDAEVPGGDIAVHLGMELTTSIADLISYGTDLSPEILERALVSYAPGLSVLSSPGDRFEEPPEPGYIRPILQAITGEERYIVVDAPPFCVDEMASLAGWADGLLLVTTPELTSLRRTEVLIAKAVENDVVEEGQILVIVNQANLRTGIPEEAFPPAILERKRFTLPVASKAIWQAINAGEPILFQAPRHRFCMEIREIARYLLSDESDAVPSAPSRLRRLIQSIAARQKQAQPHHLG